MVNVVRIKYRFVSWIELNQRLITLTIYGVSLPLNIMNPFQIFTKVVSHTYKSTI